MMRIHGVDLALSPEELQAAAAETKELRAEKKRRPWARGKLRKPKHDQAAARAVRAAAKTLSTTATEAQRARALRVAVLAGEYFQRPLAGKAYIPPRGGDCVTLQALAQAASCSLAAPAGDWTRGILFDSEGRSYPYEVAVVPLSDLVTSHDFAGRVDPRFPQEFQARDRGAQESRLDIERMARNLNPLRLAQVGPSPAEGAPVAWPTNVGALVLAGNGRVMAIRQAPAELREAYFDTVQGLTGARGVLVRVVRITADEARALAAASQRSASAPESPLEMARALLRGIANVASLDDLPPLELEHLTAPLTEATVSRFEALNRGMVELAYPEGAPASAAARADRYRSIFLGLMPAAVAETVQALGFEAEEAFAGLAPFLAELRQRLRRLPESLAWLDPLPRLARAAPLMRRFRGRSRSSILAAITADVENLHMFGSPLEGMEALDVGWLLGLLSALNVQAPEKRGVELGRALRSHAMQEAQAASSSFFGYEPVPGQQLEAVFGPQLAKLMERFEGNLAGMGLGLKRNPVLIVNPKKGGAKRGRRKGWPKGAIPIDQLPPEFLEHPSFAAARNDLLNRYGAEPEFFIPVDAPPGSQPVLAAIGELGETVYRAADGPGEPVSTWVHEGGDQGKGRARTRPPILAWDGLEGYQVIVLPPGAHVHWDERGISG